MLRAEAAQRPSGRVVHIQTDDRGKLSICCVEGGKGTGLAVSVEWTRSYFREKGQRRPMATILCIDDEAQARRLFKVALE